MLSEVDLSSRSLPGKLVVSRLLSFDQGSDRAERGCVDWYQS